MSVWALLSGPCDEQSPHIADVATMSPLLGRRRFRFPANQTQNWKAEIQVSWCREGLRVTGSS